MEIKKYSFKNVKDRIYDIFNKLLKISSDPNYLAFSITLGVFIGIIFPIGFQTLIIIPLALIFKLNVYIATISTLVTNPVTIAPIYYITYHIGNFFTSQNLTWNEIKIIMNSPTIEKLSIFGMELVITVFLGNIILASVTSIIIYFISFRLILVYKNRQKKIHSNNVP